MTTTQIICAIILYISVLIALSAFSYKENNEKLETICVVMWALPGLGALVVLILGLLG